MPPQTTGETAVFTGRPLDPSPEAIEEARRKVGIALVAMAECRRLNYGAVRLDRLTGFAQQKQEDK